uniref:Cilia and flagella associated protein 298 n=1 Tax=Laticauda laticaudata TaxID=8630 RepID=A0A8C5SJ99_LATLA
MNTPNGPLRKGVRSIVDSLRLKFLGFGEETIESGRIFQTLTTLLLKSYFLQSSLLRLTLSLYPLCALVLLQLKLKYSFAGRTLQCMILYTILRSDRRRRNSRFSRSRISSLMCDIIREKATLYYLYYLLIISVLQKQVEANVCVTTRMVKDALDQLRGAVMIVYPMGLPPYDPIRMEFENKEDLSGTQAALEIVEEPEAQLWWAAKELKRTNQLSDYVGKNEKTKIIIKIQKKGQGAPAREPVISSEEHKQMILFYHRRQEELKKLEENDDDSFLDSEWADSHALKRHFHGVKDIKWRPR